MKTSITYSKNKILIKAFVILFWLLVWEIAARMTDNAILLVGPVNVLSYLTDNIANRSFYTEIFGSLKNIAGGYVVGFAAGVILAVTAYRIRFIRELLAPLMTFLKTAPVASFIVLFLIWWSSARLSFAIAICIVLPQVYIGMLQGLESTDGKMLKMARGYRMSGIDCINYVYRPAIASHMEGAIKMSAGMAWKAGIAAEVIGTPDGTIGESLYMSKIYLDTEGVLGWTLVIILISTVCEKALLAIYRRYTAYDFKCHGSKRISYGVQAIRLKGLYKKYDRHRVLQDFSAEYTTEETSTIEWESGAGKTTLFKLISGEEQPDEGIIEPDAYETSVLYQEDRLCENVSAVKNVEIITGDRETAREALLKLLSEEELDRPVFELSGGQKRRVAIVRAVVKEADVYLFDEPFNGLDEQNRDRVMRYIGDSLKDKVVIIASHINKLKEVN